jgi:molybdopterin-guanine dinucleotide biosynthesis protein A
MEPAGRFGNLAAALLVGGASQRMGSDKAQLPLDGSALATRIARVLAAISEELWLVGGSPPADAPGRRIADLPGPQCSLRGLASALRACEAEWVLVVATDLPLVSAELLLGLAAWPDADAVVPRDARGTHALCARYRKRAVLPIAEQRLAAGELALRGVLDAVATSYVEGETLAALDPDAMALVNVNTPEELARARAWLASRGPTRASAR